MPRPDLHQHGFYGIGVFHPKNSVNVGTLWRSGLMFGAAFLFTIGPRFKQQCSDTMKAWRRVPMLTFDSFEMLVSHLPFSCPLVAVELVEPSIPLPDYRHRKRACYLLGAEDHGLPASVLERCVDRVWIPTAYPVGPMSSLNVATAGTLVIYDRLIKNGWKKGHAT